MQKFQYVDDEIVVINIYIKENIVKKQINEYEKEKKSYILEGYPKTFTQGL